VARRRAHVEPSKHGRPTAGTRNGRHRRTKKPNDGSPGPDGSYMKPYEQQFWRDVETELHPHQLTARLRWEISFALRHAIWEHQDDHTNVEAGPIDWRAFTRNGGAVTETLYPTHGERRDLYNRLSATADAITALRATLKCVDDWPAEQQAREGLPSPRRPAKQREMEMASGRVRGHKPFALYAAEHRAALDRALAPIAARIERDLAMYASSASITNRYPWPGRHPDRRRLQLVGSILDALQREGIPVKQTKDGVADRVLRVVLRGYQSVLEGKPLKECRAPKYMQNIIRSAHKFRG
jgi:hypothetical protein